MDRMKPVRPTRAVGAVAMAVVVMFGTLTVLAARASAAPTNDDFVQAIAITALPFDDSRSTVDATRAGDDPAECGAGPTIWYVLQPTIAAEVEADTFGSDYDTTLSVYTGSQGSLDLLDCNDDSNGLQSRITFEASAGATYYLMVGGYDDASTGSLALQVREVTPLPSATNDEIDEAPLVTSLDFDEQVSTAAATRAADDPVCDAAAGPTVWYAFRFAAATDVNVTAAGTDHAVAMSAYTGSRGNLAEVACQAFEIAFRAAAGETYYVMVAAYEPGGGNLSVAMHAEAAPLPATNDDFDSATVIGGVPFVDRIDTSLTTTVSDDPSCPVRPNGSVWYRFAPPADVTIAIDTAGSDYEHSVGVFTGSRSALTAVACDAWSAEPGIVLRARAGTTYHVMVGSREPGAAGGRLSFSIGNGPPPPPNDDFDRATVVTLDHGADGTLFRHEVDANAATTSADDPTCDGRGHTVWYRLVAERNVRLEVNGFDTEPGGSANVAVYTGPRGGLSQVGCNDNRRVRGGQVIFDAARGTTYHVMVFSAGLVPTSTVRLAISERPPEDARVAEIVAGLPAPLSTPVGVRAGDGVLLFGGGPTQPIAYDPTKLVGRYAGYPMPESRSQMAAARIGTTTYLFGGTSSTARRDILAYDETTGSMRSTGVSLPTPRTSPSAVTDGRYAYVFAGGRVGRPCGGIAKDVLRFDPVTNELIRLQAELPSLREGMATAFDGRYAYLMGGFSCGQQFSDIVRYDTTSDTMQVMGARLPHGMGAASAAWDGQSVWLFHRGSVWRYDPAADVLHATPAELLRRSGTTAIFDGRSILVFGGGTDAVERFDPATGEVTYLGVTADAAAASFERSTYVFGGKGLDQIARLDRANPSVEILDTRLPTALDGAAAVTAGGHIYLLGGRRGLEQSDAILRFDPRTQSVETMSARLPTGRSSGAVVTAGRYIYLLGGWEDDAGWIFGDWNGEIVRYDTQADTVTVMGAQIPHPRGDRLSAVWDGRRALLFGAGPDDLTKQITAYDPAADELSVLDDTTPGMEDAVALWHGGRAVIAGTYEIDPTHARVASYAPATGESRMLYVSLPVRTLEGASGALEGSDVWLFGADESSAVIRFDLQRT